MRLINTAALRLERFDDDTKTPPYAILSHTWGSEEVSLQHFQDAATADEPVRTSVKAMLGFEKIVKACEQALEDEYAYIWVDTCCIDKTSSAELSEAINSMFRWYKQAQVCYAVLEDFTPLAKLVCETEAEVAREILKAEEHMATARWFGRGWTLQELIAPRHVRFYAADWTLIGTKKTLFKQLARITGIDRNLLSGTQRLYEFSVAKRMSWAANRTTTRIEDIAYSLMSVRPIHKQRVQRMLTWYPSLRGMFDVNMPLLYGEGEKAFTRLQEEILKENDDQSIFAWSSASTKASSNSLNYVDMAELQQEGCVPIFAKHPRNFAQAKDIYPQDPLGEPTTITNKGVRIDLPILRMESLSKEILHRGEWMYFFLAVLHCGYVHDKSKHPAIILRRFTSESSLHTYMRHEAAGIFPVRHDEVRSSDMRQVYLRKQPRTGVVREHWRYQTPSMTRLYERVNLGTSTAPRIFQLKDDSQDRKDQYAKILRRLGWGNLA